jgi:sugar/nucleoside kinase (ribokinase family)
LPDTDFIKACAVLMVDHYGLTGALRAARIARAAKIAVLADFENDRGQGFHEVLSLVDHLILSSAFACRLTSQSDAAKAALALWRADRAAVIVTCGAEGCWSVDSQNSGAVHHPAFAVKAVDTTGCGDVFHGAYAAGLARSDSLAERIRFSSAAAALRARDSDSPRRAQVEEFLAGQIEHFTTLP